MSSGSCCPPESCDCGNWLQSFCDWETVSHRFCGQTLSFAFARGTGVSLEAVRPETGVYHSDKLMYLSVQEQQFETGPGAVLTLADGTEWQVYNAQYVTSFCVWKLWCRNVAVCFQLNDRVDVYEASVCDGCISDADLKFVGRTKGRVLTSGGQHSMEHESDRISVTFTMDLSEWRFSDHPRAYHRLKVKDKTYSVRQFEDRGPYVPYALTLDRLND